jgi:hypothetical protein
MRIAWIALGILIAHGSLAESPKSSGTAESRPPIEINIANQARPEQYPTKDAPLPVTILQSPEDTQRAAERERRADQNEKTYLDTQIGLVKFARATVFISGIGALIAVAALIFLIKTFRETRNAAVAARDQVNINREEFLATHRPKIIIRACKLSGDGVTADHMWPCRLVYTNIGVSTAYIRKIGTRVWNGPSPWTRPDRAIQFNEDTSNEVLKSGQNGSFLTSKDFNCDQIETIWFFAGYIEYSDREVDGTIRKVGFIRRWMGSQGRGLGDHEWSKYGGGNEEYEYCY